MLIPPTDDSIALAAAALRRGELVAFPTETVYGLGADATNGVAVAAVFEIKGRPRFNPLIVHVADAGQAERYAHFNDAGHRLAEAFWPGALTLVLDKRPDGGLADLVSAGLDTVAIRVPGHGVAQALLREAGVPIAAPSANRSGHVSPTTAAHVAEDFGDRELLILDGGATPLGLESTVVDATTEPPVLLRPGAVARSDIEALLGQALADVEPAERPRSPGLTGKHYAPRARLRLGALAPAAGEALLAFGPNASGETETCINLSPSGDLKEAAANLFGALRALDASGAQAIAVMPIPREGLGEAINDRLRRAAAEDENVAS